MKVDAMEEKILAIERRGVATAVGSETEAFNNVTTRERLSGKR